MLTGIIWFGTTLMMYLEIAEFMLPVVIAGCIYGAIIGISIYYLRAKKEKPEPQDERTAMCSLKATRNAFLITLVSLTIYMVFGQMGAPLVKILALQSIWGISVAAYTVSYYYYKGSF
jgi:predicted exporter